MNFKHKEQGFLLTFVGIWIILGISVIVGGVYIYNWISEEKTNPSSAIKNAIDIVKNVASTTKITITTGSTPTPTSTTTQLSTSKNASVGTSISPEEQAIKDRLTPLQYEVTRKNGTEQPYKNAYWDSYEEGIYVDVVSGDALFSSYDKYNSYTGWPSFTKPIADGKVMFEVDSSYGESRTEVRSVKSDSHLGHVFDDGPKPLGKRYCMNSAALKFIPKASMEKEGYGEYLSLFK